VANAVTLLQGYTGVLQTDGYTGVLRTDGYAAYRSLADPKRAGGPATLAFCWAHWRRQWFDIAKSPPAPTARPCKRIAELYEIKIHTPVLALPVDGRPVKSWLLERILTPSAGLAFPLAEVPVTILSDSGLGPPSGVPLCPAGPLAAS
jgi:hypothetical protein